MVKIIIVLIRFLEEDMLRVINALLLVFLISLAMPVLATEIGNKILETKADSSKTSNLLATYDPNRLSVIGAGEIIGYYGACGGCAGDVCCPSNRRIACEGDFCHCVKDAQCE